MSDKQKSPDFEVRAFSFVTRAAHRFPVAPGSDLHRTPTALTAPIPSTRLYLVSTSTTPAPLGLSGTTTYEKTGPLRRERTGLQPPERAAAYFKPSITEAIRPNTSSIVPTPSTEAYLSCPA